MRRIVTLLLVATVVLIMVAAGVVVAVNKLWNSFPCRGTDNNDQLHEQIGTHKKDRSWASRAANFSTPTTMGGTGIGWRAVRRAKGYSPMTQRQSRLYEGRQGQRHVRSRRWRQYQQL